MWGSSITPLALAQERWPQETTSRIGSIWPRYMEVEFSFRRETFSELAFNTSVIPKSSGSLIGSPANTRLGPSQGKPNSFSDQGVSIHRSPCSPDHHVSFTNDASFRELTTAFVWYELFLQIEVDSYEYAFFFFSTLRSSWIVYRVIPEGWISQMMIMKRSFFLRSARSISLRNTWITVAPTIEGKARIHDLDANERFIGVIYESHDTGFMCVSRNDRGDSY